MALQKFGIIINTDEDNLEIGLEADFKNVRLMNKDLDLKSKLRLIKEIEKSNNVLLISSKSKFVKKALSCIKNELKNIKSTDEYTNKLHLKILICENFTALVNICDEIQIILGSDLKVDFDKLRTIIITIDKYINENFEKIDDKILEQELYKIQNEIWWESKRNLINSTIDFIKQGIKFSESFELIRSIYKTNPDAIKKNLISDKELTMKIDEID